MRDATQQQDRDGAQPAVRVREFLHVAKMLPAHQELVTVPPGTAVRDALTLMSRHGFDQLPVVAGTSVVGVFSYRSLAEGLPLVRQQDDPLGCAVDDFVEDVNYVRAGEEVGDVLAKLNEHGVVLVGDERNLIAVATATDVVDFLWETTRPFVLLQDIELACRDLMTIACPSPAVLASCLQEAAGNVFSAEPDVRELSLGELLNVLFNRKNFGTIFSSTFGANRDLAYSVLEPVREIRNKVFHFRDDVTVADLETLVAARRWLLRKTRMVGAT